MYQYVPYTRGQTTEVCVGLLILSISSLEEHPKRVST